VPDMAVRSGPFSLPRPYFVVGLAMFILFSLSTRLVVVVLSLVPLYTSPTSWHSAVRGSWATLWTLLEKVRLPTLMEHGHTPYR
jgi:hypothetical protein